MKNEAGRKSRKQSKPEKYLKHRLKVFSRVKIDAPEVIDIFKLENYKKLIHFITTIRELILDGEKVLISFKNTHTLKANAVVVLYAHFDFFQRITGNKRIVSITQCANQRANSFFRNSGVWELVGFQAGIDQDILPIVSAVAGSGSIGETIPAKDKIREVLLFIRNEIYSGKISEKEGMRLYVAITESISNVGLHAYPLETVKDYEEFVNIAGKRWWILARKVQDQLFLVIYDMGEGIPCSLVKSSIFSQIEQIFKPKTDADKIQSALKYGETRMNNQKHGKGLPEIKSYVLDNPMGELHIYSGMGQFCYSTELDEEKKVNLPYSIGGTLIQWNIQLMEDK